MKAKNLPKAKKVAFDMFQDMELQQIYPSKQERLKNIKEYKDIIYSCKTYDELVEEFADMTGWSYEDIHYFFLNNLL